MKTKKIILMISFFIYFAFSSYLCLEFLFKGIPEIYNNRFFLSFYLIIIMIFIIIYPFVSLLISFLYFRYLMRKKDE